MQKRKILVEAHYEKGLGIYVGGAGDAALVFFWDNDNIYWRVSGNYRGRATVCAIPNKRPRPRFLK